MKRELLIGIIGSIIATIICGLSTWLIEYFWGDEVADSWIMKSLWLTVPLVVIVWGVVAFVSIWNSNKMKYPGFLKTSQMDIDVNNKWVWRWKKLENGEWTISDLKFLCPHCGMVVNCQLYRGYQCINGHTYAGINYSDTRAQIIHEMRKKYPKFSHLINGGN